MNKTIKKLIPLSVLFSALVSTSASAFETSKLEKVIKGEQRTAKYAERDQYRHPQQTLEFFGIKDDMTVVEISPGGGWYTEILAPYLRDNGTYIAAGFNPQSEVEYYSRNAKAFAEKLKSNPAVYDKTQVTIMEPPSMLDIAKAGSADMVVSFRNTHGWHRRGHSEAVYGAIFKALKPGGIFGVVQHRAGAKVPADTSGKLGYLKQADVIAIAEKAGFKLVATSEINANPKDTKDHPDGVWALPPGYRHGDKDKQKYMAIGESDRMTLKFVKPNKS
ncbi:class I SAM-dependent methyltransferase [Aliikangiella marina]|uniref:Class I SAM-dependent methyltransferase n=1 Tax=Aliikangiella marina TaxID=1712262 RepID=A0A545T6Y1_9GAMM|nr:class I SAM-dependent methyltransferase [Aliikangiella marina]TQV72979.1 class I SAM-dependent methyltransferase [Aliikangiella marina]